MSADSRSSQPRPHADNRPSKPSPVSSGKRSYSTYLSDVDRKFKQLSRDVLPAHPYILSVPTEKPYRLGSRFVSNWAVGENTLFSPEEEQLQYMTFLPHQGEDTLLVSVGGWSDDKGNIVPEEDQRPPSRAASMAAPLTTASQHDALAKRKKKITLSDYKKKALETPPPPPTPPLPGAADPSTNGANGTNGNRPGSVDSDKTLRRPQSNSSKPEAKQNHLQHHQHHHPSQAAAPATSSTSSAPDTRTGSRSNDTKQNGQDNPSVPASTGRVDKNTKLPQSKPSLAKDSPPRKKPRLSIQPEEREKEKTPTKKAGRARQMVPELLSPTLPFDNESFSLSLPPLLSPTLPPDIEEELARLPDDGLEKTSRSHSSSISSISNKAIPSKPKPGANSSSVKQSQQSSLAAEKKPASISSSTTLPPKPPTASSKPTTSQPTPRITTTAPREKLIVKLKYGRQNRKRIEALLKISSKRKPTPTQTSAKPKGLPDSIVVSKSSPPNSSPQPSTTTSIGKQSEPSSGYKRPKAMDGDDVKEPALKRPRSSNTLAPPLSDQAPTPSMQTPRSTSATKHPPASSQDQFLTPKKEPKGTAMRRVGSGDSDMKTPSGSATSVKMTQSLSVESHPSSSAQPSERRGWRDEYQRFVNLGRDLKHASQRNSTHKYSTSHDIQDDKLSATIAVEALLCFVLAFIAEQRFQSLSRQVGNSTGWRSIIAYWQSVLNRTTSYPHLHGICLLLGAACHDSIHSLDLERLATTPFPDEHSPAPTPGSDGNTVTSEETKKQRREFAELRTRLPESYKVARRLWLEGSRELSDSVLTQHYPNTWSKRLKNSADRGREQLKLGEYGGDFYLPLGTASTPLEAVRFAWAFLNEWSEREGVKWKGRLGL